jgi:Tfp pilus assembly protein PilO
LFAGIGVAVVALLMVLLVVLPKMTEVTAAKDTLAERQREQTTLTSQRAALLDAKDRAPEARQTIEDVQRRIPPVADEAGLYQLLKNAGTSSGLDVVTISVSNPAFDAATGLTTISASVTASGTYFEITEFMYEIETLPRAAKATNITLSPLEGVGSIPTLSLSTTVLLYTSDASAGPGSVPGPTDASEAGA